MSELERVTRERDMLVDSLVDISMRPTVERNPDGVDQAAATMQLIAQDTLGWITELREHLAKHGERHSWTSCPPGTRAMCDFAPRREA